jgi:hypothetical protein
MADRQGLELHKSRRRDPLALDFDRWMLVDAASKKPVAGVERGRPTMTLDEIEAHLRKGR